MSIFRLQGDKGRSCCGLKCSSCQQLLNDWLVFGDLHLGQHEKDGEGHSIPICAQHLGPTQNPSIREFVRPQAVVFRMLRSTQDGLPFMMSNGAKITFISLSGRLLLHPIIELASSKTAFSRANLSFTGNRPSSMITYFRLAK